MGTVSRLWFPKRGEKSPTPRDTHHTHTHILCDNLAPGTIESVLLVKTGQATIHSLIEAPRFVGRNI